MKIKLALLLLSGVLFLLSALSDGSLRSAASTATLENPSLYPDPIASLKIPGHSGARLANPVRLPFERTLPGPPADWVLMTASGNWSNEYILDVQPLGPKGFRYAQRSGRACEGLKPWWILANRRTGQGLALMLAYMGNWTFQALPRDGAILVRLETAPSGLKPFATIHGLPIPGALAADFTGHWDYGAQPITAFIRENLLRDHGESWPPVQFNTYYEKYENVNQEQALREARQAAAIGCELFTVDACWFGEGTGQNWVKGLGDWEVNRDRFPGGLEAVAAEVRRLGMKFGLWFELECAHPTSRLARKHPDWFLTDARGRRIAKRDVLDFGKPEVLAYARQTIADAMTRYRLDYIKMDFNIDPAINNQDLAPAADPLYRHYRGLASLWSWMREQYPALIIENCASGSLRQELTAAALTDTHWISDRVDNQPNLMMMFGATYLFPPSICSHWTVRPDRKDPYLDLDAQFAVNMMGHLGLSGAIGNWDKETLATARTRIAQYKQIRPVIRRAEVFHLTTQRLGAMQAALYVDSATSHALLFAFHGGDPTLQRTFKLRGLDPNRRYRITPLEGHAAEPAPPEVSTTPGKSLIETGLTVAFPHPGAAKIYELTTEPDQLVP